MISIIASTNRKSSNSLIFAQKIKELIEQKNGLCQILDLKDLPSNFIFENEVFGNDNAPVNQIAERFISNANKLIFVIPEYNGSFPGVLKSFIDSFAPSRIKGKYALIFGISSGRAGNVRGLDHFTGVLNYLDVNVLPTKIAVSQCHSLIDYEENKLTDSATIELLETQVNRFLTI